MGPGPTGPWANEPMAPRAQLSGARAQEFKKNDFPRANPRPDGAAPGNLPPGDAVAIPFVAMRGIIRPKPSFKLQASVQK